jgi:CDP-paratose 2-epimerase
MRQTASPPLTTIDRPVLITGGCGFIGCNLADALLTRGQRVLVLDNLARPGVEKNRAWLESRHGNRITVEIGDVRDAETVNALVRQVSAVLHLAGQVAVTTSLEDPKEDFAINAAGTLNVLEAVRCLNPGAPMLFASTNKVYGRMFGADDVTLRDTRYQPRHPRFANGVSEKEPLDLYSPYGCSKGAADQYVADYARVFGLRTAVLRMSCIYGVRQFGTEDQGWVAHFMKRAIAGQPITLYGDGYQVRDILYVDDAVAAWLAVLDSIELLAGRIFNLGGGGENSVSLRELLGTIAEVIGQRPQIACEDWRPGDQPWYVSDTTNLRKATGWRPQKALPDGLDALRNWLADGFVPAPGQLAEARA